MNREHSSRGYKCVTDVNEVTRRFYGLTVVEEAVITDVSPPSGNLDEPRAYEGDEPGLAGLTLPIGYYPIRGSTITLTSGKVILWLE